MKDNQHTVYRMSTTGSHSVHVLTAIESVICYHVNMVKNIVLSHNCWRFLAGDRGVRACVDLPQVVEGIPLGNPSWFWMRFDPNHEIKARTNHPCVIYTISNLVVFGIMMDSARTAWLENVWISQGWLVLTIRSDAHGRSTQAPMSQHQRECSWGHRLNEDWHQCHWVRACGDYTRALILTFITWLYSIVQVKSLGIWPGDSPWNSLSSL